ncbi:MAG: NUDIX domain-containing protein [Chloroflexi bacterium]|nr:MAG: NUDIX domain-containing protein [Chloroflexota bacterium]
MSELPRANDRYQTLNLQIYPGYPDVRLVMSKFNISTDATLPDGPWSTNTDRVPSILRQEELHSSGYQLDSNGRPLHPWIKRMITDRNTGVVTGRGSYWQWGPNYTADPIVITSEPTPKILLIQRSDTGSWALPGGFVDADESADRAARRELFEETGLVINDTPTLLYKGVVDDPRATAHAWPETTAYVWRIDKPATVKASDDAVHAEWFCIDTLPDQLHGSHKHLIALAVNDME